MRYAWLKLTVLALIGISAACQNLSHRLNQEGALESIKNIRAAEQTYKVTKGAGKYGSLKELAEAGLVKNNLSEGHDLGYRFNIKVIGNSYMATAVPEAYGENAYKGTGAISYFVDETGVIRWGDKKGAEANSNDPPLGKQ